VAIQDLIDQPAPVRQGEALDSKLLATFLQKQFPDLDVSTLEVKQFPSGHSNLTYLLQVGEREMILRRPPFGAAIKTAHDMRREFQILSHLVHVYPKVPQPLAFCEDDSVLGVPFYLMERLKGVILRSHKSEGLELSPVKMRTLAENFVDNLVEIHQVDYQAAGLGNLGHPEGYVRRQVEGWTQRYNNAKTDDIPDIQRVITWLSGHWPAETGSTMIHNDYKYDNLVLDPNDIGHIIGVLDWEMATIGDPLMDLGTSLGYWIDPEDSDEMKAMSFGLTILPGNLNRYEVAERYAHRSGKDISNICFYYVYALFKIAVIVQQIYARYTAGFTKDERFASFIYAVGVLGRKAIQVIEKERIDNL